MKISAVIPTLNAAASLPATLACLGSVADIVVADGGSRDGTPDLARNLGARVIDGARGRGPQIAAGIAAARGAWLLILHADTRLSPDWPEVAAAHMRDRPDQAGYFRFALDSDAPAARRLERAVAWRCRMLALPYGDQGLLIRRATLDAVGGMRPLMLMEDVDLIRRLGRHRLVPLPASATTSAARWEREGWTRRSVRNLFCLSLWFLGVPPDRIARLYA